jgi:aromatic ring-opening dioxygenase LigB subunit
MSLKFASICPHPPIIIPTIGSPYDLEKVSQTIEAMEKLAKIFQKAQPETLIIISPHGEVSYDEMTLTISPTHSGNFQMFGAPQTKMNFENDLEFVDILQEKCKSQKIPVRLEDISQLDHGCLVPLYYLTKDYILKDYNPPTTSSHSSLHSEWTPGKTLKVVPIAYSMLDKKIHFDFGKKIFEVSNIEGKTKDKKIAIVASGDLSHRLSLDAPAGFSPKGAEFDEKLVKLLKWNDSEGILNMKTDLVREAGECGYLSIIILLGALSKIKKSKFEILSYEGPFGVGYLVANVRL